MGEAAKVYAEELHKLAYGHPLWWPEHTKGPGGYERPIEIGDVGYIDTDGAFHPLFNFAHEREHELNAGKTPPNFTPLTSKLDELIETKTSFLQPGPQSSSSIKRHQSWTEIAGHDLVSGSGVGLSYRFECSKKQGAILMLWDDATKTELRLQQTHFMKYMKTHHESWYRFAYETLGINCEREDIILVCGFIKTSCWTVAALAGESDHTREVMLNGQLGPLFNVGAGYASRRGQLSSIQQRSGPTTRMSISETMARAHWQTLLGPTCTTSRDALAPVPAHDSSSRDQCVFLNYYKIKYNSRFLRKIVAAAGPSDFPGPDGSIDHEVPGLLVELSPSGDDIQLQTESFLAKPLTPIDMILDYILECSDALVAMASYNDLENFELDDQWPTSFPGILRYFSPKIFVDDCVGTLSMSPSMALPILPPEILCLVARYLVDDIAILKNCSLVCRSWYGLCGPHLFSTLRPLCGSLSSDPAHCLQAFSSFITNSESTPYFCRWVHRLCLMGHEQSNSRAVVSARILSAILAKLPNIRILELACVDIFNYASDASVVEPKTLQLPRVELDTLSMDHVRFGEHFSSQLSSILGLFSSLRMLRIRNPTVINTSSHKDPTLLRQEYLRVEELLLEAYPPTKVDMALTVDQAINTLLKTHSFGSLRSIETRCHTVDELQALGKLIRNVHETLHDVFLDLSHIVGISDDYHDIAEILDLDICDSLQKLCINVFPDPTESPAPSQWKRASELLIEVISMAPRSITSITIPLLSHNIPDRDIICWEALDRLEKGFGWERFGNLSELIIAFTPNCGCAHLSEYYVSSKLPDLASRGVLKFISTSVFAGQPDENLPVQSYDRDDRLPFHAWQRHRAAGRHILMNYANQHLTTRNGRIQIIPQGVFPASQTYTPLPNVTFTVSGALGIRLVDALNPAFHGLCDAGVVPRMTKDSDAKKFILRLKWPGYPAWSEVIHAYDHTYMANPNTLKKVAQLAAQKIQMFCHELHRHPYDVSSGGDGWQIERHPLETLVLLELRHVSQGSWQPVLACL